MCTDRIIINQADITKLECDAIVNAANHSLLGGEGVDGAIHRAAGKDLFEACKKLHGCDTGKAKITPGFRLPSKYVIHTVGPIWRGGNSDEASLLESCYRESLHLARQFQFKTMAFPNISTGKYGFPKAMAARIALKTVDAFLKENAFPQTVIFACFDSGNFEIYQTTGKTD